tara:strand:- start:71 stop:712 length:642 start_codon:yes stop_codon:yes gene_type:complete
VKSIVLASSKGIGKGIADELEKFGDVVRTSTKELDTSDMNQVYDFVDKNKTTDILVLNTGGPPAKDFWSISEEEWVKYFNQMFLSFVYILRNLKVNDNGYIFLMSSHLISEPNPNMSLSVTYRIALSSLLKMLSTEFATRGVSCINIAPGPIGTERLQNLVDDINEFEKTLPMGRVGEVEEISKFVSSIVENKIKYLTGVTINFDGGVNRYVL